MVIAAYVFITAGLIIMFFGILGTVVLPDFLTRSHAATKCGVTGTITVLIGFILYAADFHFGFKFGIIIVFLFFTAPITAHVMAFSYSKDRFFRREDEE